MDYKAIAKILRSAPSQTQPDFLHTVNKEHLINLTENFHTNIKGLNVELQNSAFVSNAKDVFVKNSQDEKIYQLGKFEGITQAVAVLTKRRCGQSQFQQSMSNFVAQPVMNQILHFIYEHPNVQHKRIAASLNMKANSLTYRINQLIEAGCVDVYSQGKYKYYDLTLKSREYLSKNEYGSTFLHSSVNPAYVNRYFSTRAKDHCSVTAYASVRPRSKAAVYGILDTKPKAGLIPQKLSTRKALASMAAAIGIEEE